MKRLEPREVKQLTQGHRTKEGQSQTRTHYLLLLIWCLKPNCKYLDLLPIRGGPMLPSSSWPWLLPIEYMQVMLYDCQGKSHKAMQLQPPLQQTRPCSLSPEPTCRKSHDPETSMLEMPHGDNMDTVSTKPVYQPAQPSCQTWVKKPYWKCPPNLHSWKYPQLLEFSPEAPDTTEERRAIPCVLF